MASIEIIAEALRKVASTGMKPKDLLAAVREQYPHVTKKEVVRAAFYVLTESQDGSPEHRENLHSFAITQRGGDEHEPVKSGKLSKKKKARQEAAAASVAER